MFEEDVIDALSDKDSEHTSESDSDKNCSEINEQANIGIGIGGDVIKNISCLHSVFK
jgi:hypothetical protein